MKKAAHYYLGKTGEVRSLEYLKKNGYTILDTNVHTPYGEIDIIARQKRSLAFIEVKTRRTRAYGSPAEAITKKKKEHLIRSAEYLIAQGRVRAKEYRFDVLELVVGDDDDRNDFFLIKDAFIKGEDDRL
jgi:putative endonuclease